MTSYTDLISVFPPILEEYVLGLGGRLLTARLDARYEKGEYYFYSDDYITDDIEYDVEFAACIESAPDDHPLKQMFAELARDIKYGDIIDLSDMALEQILQAIIFESEGAIRFFELEAAATCTRVSPRQVGGWCSFVTANEVRSLNTGLWLNEQQESLGL